MEKKLEKIYEELCRPFPADKIRWRIGSRTKDRNKGKLLAYIDARDVMERLDQTVGFQNWEDSYEDTAVGNETGVKCYLSIRLPLGHEDDFKNVVTKADAASATQVEDLKGAYSDALKRAAVKFGIGRDLYDIDGPWVKLKEGKYFDKKDIPKLPPKYYKEAGEPTDKPPKSRKKRAPRKTPKNK